VERAKGLDKVQLGVEATGAKGTVVAANRYLGSLDSFGPAVNLGINSERRPMGSKFAEYVVPNREWVEADFDGPLTYGEIVYLLSSAYKRLAAPVGPSPAGAYTWRFEIDRFVQEDPQTYTVEIGGAEGAERFAYGLIPDLSIELGTEDVGLSGKFLGKDYTTGAVLTAAPTSVERVPVHPSHVSAFMDPTPGALGTTRLTRAFTAELALTDHWGAVFAMNAQLARGWAAHVERKPAISLSLTVEADAVGMGLVAAARAGSTRYLRFQAIGGQIGAGPDTYELTIEGAFKISEVGEQDEDQDVTTQAYDLIPTYDSTLGYALAIEAVNMVAAL
jgi:hypothetical protein